MTPQQQELIESVLSGPADAQMAQQALLLIGADPEAAAAFVIQRRMALLLAAVLRRRPGAEVAARVRIVVAARQDGQRRIRQVRQRLPAPGGWRVWYRWPALAAGMLAAIGTAALLLLRPGTHPSIPQVVATVSASPVALLAAGGAWRLSAQTSVQRQLLASGDPIFSGDMLENATSAEMQVRYPDGTMLSLDGPGWLSLDGDAGSKLVELISGDLTASVEPQFSTAAMRVRTALAEVSVHGTRLRLRRSSDGDRIELYLGTVSVSPRDARNGGSEALLPGRVMWCRTDGTHEQRSLAGTALLTWNFNGATTLPWPWHDARLTAGPPGTPDPPCVAGVELGGASGRYGVQLVDPPAELLSYDPDHVLEFDYWASAAVEGSHLWVGSGHRADQSDISWHQIPLGHLVIGRWTHAALRLGDLRPEKPDAVRLRPGASIFNIAINFDHHAGQDLYLDQVTISPYAQP